MVRTPQQSRSKATVDSIIEAGFICVAENGMHDTSTRHIADKAGISVGSLYEYFKNKDMIYDAMNQRMAQDVVQMLQPMMPKLMEMEVEQAIRTMLHGLEELLCRNEERYLRCVRANMSSTNLDRYIAPITQLLEKLMMQYMLHHPENMHITRIPIMSYIFMHGGIYSLIQHLSQENPPFSFEELSDGLAAMVGHYVTQEKQLAQNGAE